MLSEFLVKQLQSSQDFLLNTVSSFDEIDSCYAPGKDMLTVAQHVYSLAEAANWFTNGAFSFNGFDSDYESMKKRVENCKSLEEAVKSLKAAIRKAVENIEMQTDDYFSKVLPPPIEADILNSIIWVFTDHMAHHRGSLAVYARNLGKIPKPCYADK